MSQVIRTEAGAVTIGAVVGRVNVNGSSVLPHEACQLAAALVLGAAEARDLAAKAGSEALAAAQ